MAFLDNFSKKITEVSQSAVQKTKNMADIVKLNTQVSEEEKKINDMYLQIGKLYVDRYSMNNADVDINACIESIRVSHANIEECKKMIEDLKGVEKCPSCGAEVESDVLFCPLCGATVKVIEAPQMMPECKVCPACNAQVPRDSNFCTSCGHALEK